MLSGKLEELLKVSLLLSLFHRYFEGASWKLIASISFKGTVCYTGDVSDPNKGNYNLDYYLEYVRQLKDLGIHVLAIKDMAGLLKPESAKMLVSAIRAEHFDLPIHGELKLLAFSS